MKTQKIFRLGFILIALLAIVATGCKKDNTTNTKSSDTSSLQQLTKDEDNVTHVSDDASNDANVVLSGSTPKMFDPYWPCHVTLDSTRTSNDTITYYLTYNGTNCNGHLIRTGKQEVKIKVGTYWGQSGTVVITKLINFTVTHVYSGKTVKLNGTRTFENVSGGLIWQLNGTNSITQRISGTMQATFDDNSTRTWHIARQHVFTGTLPDQLVLTTDGFGVAGGYTNLFTWGTTRNGEQFYTKDSVAVLHKQVCNWNPVSGVIVHQVPSDDKKATVTYGYDDNNQPVTGDNCPTRYRVDWEKNGNFGTIFLPLP